MPIDSNKVKIATIKLDTNKITVDGIATKLNGIESLLVIPELKVQVY